MPARKSGTRSKTDARLVRGRDTEEKCMELRMQNLTLRQIGERLDLTAQGVSDAIVRGLARTHDPDLVKTVRLTMLSYYYALIEKDFYDALKGNEKARFRVLEVMHRAEKVAGCHQEAAHGVTGPAVAFNYYMPVAQKDEMQHVDPADFNLPRLTAGNGATNGSTNGSTNGHNGNGVTE